MKLTPAQIKERAAFFGCHHTTIRRWNKKGVDVFNIEAVADYLIDNPSATPEALEAVINYKESCPKTKN